MTQETDEEKLGRIVRYGMKGNEVFSDDSDMIQVLKTHIQHLEIKFDLIQKSLEKIEWAYAVDIDYDTVDVEEVCQTVQKILSELYVRSANGK